MRQQRRWPLVKRLSHPGPERFGASRPFLHYAAATSSIVLHLQQNDCSPD